jgi:hypothetical protein
MREQRKIDERVQAIIDDAKAPMSVKVIVTGDYLEKTPEVYSKIIAILAGRNYFARFNPSILLRNMPDTDGDIKISSNLFCHVNIFESSRYIDPLVPAGVAPEFLKDANIAIIVCDRMVPASLEAIGKWVGRQKAFCGDSLKTSILLCTNYKDYDDTVCSNAKMDELIAQYGIEAWFDVDHKNSAGFEDFLNFALLSYFHKMQQANPSQNNLCIYQDVRKYYFAAKPTRQILVGTLFFLRHIFVYKQDVMNFSFDVWAKIFSFVFGIKLNAPLCAAIAKNLPAKRAMSEIPPETGEIDAAKIRFSRGLQLCNQRRVYSPIEIFALAQGDPAGMALEQAAPKPAEESAQASATSVEESAQASETTAEDPKKCILM